ncbi:Ig-like_domain-containing protein [Hexamita inflata]|uniref:Ig-like domain-containing protein n=1 Tax=Hexamita inflata TaxID=28002 RepID=A0AA86NGG0_9EUKA|nr:Ig-like domain-containing protein [Hexamita inflata]
MQSTENQLEQQHLQELQNQKIQRYQQSVKQGKLVIRDDGELRLDYINNLNIQQLIIEECKFVHQLDNDIIKQIHIDCCDIQTLQYFNLKNLEVLVIQEIFWKPKIDLDYIVNFPKLKELTASCSQWNLSFLNPCLNQLTKLDLQFNRIYDISGLQQLTNLLYINLSKNLITDVSPLKNLKKLTYLNLFQNKVEEIQSLEYLVNLKYFNIRENNNLVNIMFQRDSYQLHALKNISVLSTLKNLAILNISSNEISDISTLSTHTSLWQLNISYNPINNISELKIQLKLPN